MRIEEFTVSLGSGDAVLFLAKAVSLIREHNIFDRNAVTADCGHHFVALDFKHARIVGALHDEQWFADILCVKERRDLAQPLTVRSRVAEFGIE